MEVFVEHLGSVQFEVSARDHKVVCDQPTEAGGFDEGMTPPEFLLASLGSCAAFYAVDYLKRSGIASTGTKVKVTAEKMKNIIPGKPAVGARLDNFTIEVEVPMELTKEQHEGIEAAVNRCLVKNTMLVPPQIKLELKTLVAR